MGTIYVIRHTETKWNEEFRYIGRTDLPLSELGERNAALLADWFEGKNLSTVFSSPMLRARQTAERIAGKFGLDIKVSTGLREIDFGKWEGLTHEEIQAEFAETHNRWLGDPSREPMPEGDKWEAFERRVAAELPAIEEAAVNGEVAVVSHGGPIKVITGLALGVPAEKYWRLYLDKGSISAFFVDERGWRLSLFNDTCYRNSPTPDTMSSPAAC